jgi:hypothetical protein
MSSCFICGKQITKGQELRKRIYTGSSVGGFNFSSSVLLNWILNSAINKRRVSVRSYYSVRTVCPSCAISIEQAERAKMALALKSVGLLIAGLLVFTVLLIMFRQGS